MLDRGQFSARFTRRARSVGLATMPSQKLRVEGVVLVREESPCAAVAPLRHMMGNPGDDDARETTHTFSVNSALAKS